MAPLPVQRQRRCHPSARRAEKRAEALRLVILLMLCERHGDHAVALFLEAHDDHALRGSARRADCLDRCADEDARARDEQQVLAAVHDLDADDPSIAQQFNPLDKIVELYERLLQSEREKIELLKKR